MYTTSQTASSISCAITAYDRPSEISIPKKEPNEYDGFRIGIANTVTKLMDAANLAYKGYLKKGFISQSLHPFVFNEWDFSGISICLVAYDQYDNCVGTLTVVPDFKKLPIDITFKEELDAFRFNGNKLCECSRFIIDDKFKNQKEILTALMEWAYLIANHYLHASDIIIEVNPRHQSFYIKKLLFVAQTGIKNCPLVNNAPAILLIASTRIMEKNIREQLTKKLMYADFKSKDQNLFEKMITYLFKECEQIEAQISLAAYMATFNETRVS